MADNEIDQNAAENEPTEQTTPETIETTPEPTTQTPPPPATPQVTPTAEDKQEASHERTTMILAGVIVILAILLCIALASAFGLGFGGGSAPPPQVETATPAPSPTPIPTPEPGEPPTAVIYAPNSGIVGIPITFDGSGSAGASALTNYEWDFGDGTGARGAVIQHIYEKSGRYTVTLTVVDEKGLSDNASLRIDISNPEPTPEPKAPTAVISAPGSAMVGEPINFDGGASSGDNPIVNYSWDFGDRSSGNGAVVQHVYNSAGTYKVTLTVTDNIGLNGQSTMEIVINAQPQTPPTAAIAGPSQAMAGDQVTYDASGSTPGSSSITNYAWDFGNGDSTSGRNSSLVNTTFKAPGRYTITLTVTDENGLSSTANMVTDVSSSLENTNWSLTQTLPGTEITVQFSKGTVSGLGGCNEYSGQFTAAGNGVTGSITISGITATRKICEEDITAQETQYLANLQGATGYAINGSTLSLTTPGATLTYNDLAAVSQ